jgi:integrase/recombinase XerD
LPRNRGEAGTINTKLLRIRAVLNYLLECEAIKNNPVKKVKRQKDDVKIDVFSDEQIRQMLNFYRRIKQRDKSYVAYRDYIIIITILGTGIRRGEVINLQ